MWNKQANTGMFGSPRGDYCVICKYTNQARPTELLFIGPSPSENEALFLPDTYCHRILKILVRLRICWCVRTHGVGLGVEKQCACIYKISKHPNLKLFALYKKCAHLAHVNGLGSQSQTQSARMHIHQTHAHTCAQLKSSEASNPETISRDILCP